MARDKKPVIGRREWFRIPELGIGWIRGKVDTGARSSSLHAREIRPFQRDGCRWVGFETVERVECEAPVVFIKRVRSSNGGHSDRFFIEVTAQTLDGRDHHLLVSLTCRASMRCPLLLGRRALREFLVDCSRSQILGKR